jgi:DNA polymerase III psi subunit
MLAEPQRRDLLAAMGIDVYVLRTAQAAMTPSTAAVSDGEWLIVAASDAAMKSIQCAQLRKSLPSIIGVASDKVRWIVAESANSFDSVPLARAYLVLGAALARSLGAHLSAKQQNDALFAFADEPAISLNNTMAKRALWQTLKPIARRAREVN